MQSIETIENFHAHIYFNSAEQRVIAAQLREEVERRFTIYVGRLVDRPIGPHSEPMFELEFGHAEFAQVVPWLMLNRRGLSILIHPNTGEARADHLENAIWLGERLAIDEGPLGGAVP